MERLAWQLQRGSYRSRVRVWMCVCGGDGVCARMLLPLIIYCTTPPHPTPPIRVPNPQGTGMERLAPQLPRGCFLCWVRAWMCTRVIEGVCACMLLPFIIYCTTQPSPSYPPIMSQTLRAREWSSYRRGCHGDAVSSGCVCGDVCVWERVSVLVCCSHFPFTVQPSLPYPTYRIPNPQGTGMERLASQLPRGCYLCWVRAWMCTRVIEGVCACMLLPFIIYCTTQFSPPYPRIMSQTLRTREWSSYRRGCHGDAVSSGCVCGDVCVWGKVFLLACCSHSPFIVQPSLPYPTYRVPNPQGMGMEQLPPRLPRGCCLFQVRVWRCMCMGKGVSACVLLLPFSIYYTAQPTLPHLSCPKLAGHGNGAASIAAATGLLSVLGACMDVYAYRGGCLCLHAAPIHHLLYNPTQPTLPHLSCPKPSGHVSGAASAAAAAGRLSQPGVCVDVCVSGRVFLLACCSHLSFSAQPTPPHLPAPNVSQPLRARE
jgi:hypothetical protein